MVDEETRGSAIAYRDRWHPDVPILDHLPEGWRVVKGTLTNPCGTCWVARGSRFNGTYQHALMWL